VSDHENSSKTSKRRCQGAESNVERCLTALEQRGEAGLQEELDRMFPGTKASPPEIEREYLPDDPNSKFHRLAMGCWRTIKRRRQRQLVVLSFNPRPAMSSTK
jgi:hypothetical protein